MSSLYATIKGKVQMLLKDQYPISSSKDIEEELIECSGAAVNAETGILTWQMIWRGETKKFRLVTVSNTEG